MLYSDKMRLADQLEDSSAHLAGINRDFIARQLGVSHFTYWKMRFIWAAAREGDPVAVRAVDQLQRAKCAIHTAYRMVRREPRDTEPSWRTLARLRAADCEIYIAGNPNPAKREGEHNWQFDIYTGTATNQQVFHAHTDRDDLITTTIQGLTEQVENRE